MNKWEKDPHQDLVKIKNFTWILDADKTRRTQNGKTLLSIFISIEEVYGDKMGEATILIKKLKEDIEAAKSNFKTESIVS